MKLTEAAMALLNQAQAFETSVEIVFDNTDITVFWHNLRIDCQPKQLDKVVATLNQLESFGVRFE